jgi:hypothetical protein
MEKVFKILVVFALLLLIIVYSFKIKERKFREYYFLRRVGVPLTGGPDWTLISATIITGEEEGRLANDQEGRLSFHAGTRATGGSSTDGLNEAAPGDVRTLTVTDQVTGLTVAAIPLTENIDGLLFAPETRLLYCCSSEGVLTIIRQNGRQEYTIMQRLPIPIGGSQLALDLRNSNLYIYAGSSVLIYANR